MGDRSNPPCPECGSATEDDGTETHRPHCGCVRRSPPFVPGREAFEEQGATIRRIVNETGSLSVDALIAEVPKLRAVVEAADAWDRSIVWEAPRAGGVEEEAVTDPRHIGPPCKRCGRPQASPAAWGELQGGEGEELCWGDDTPACDTACTTVPLAELAALRAVVQPAREALDWIDGATSGHDRSTNTLLDRLRSALDALPPSSAKP